MTDPLWTWELEIGLISGLRYPTPVDGAAAAQPPVGPFLLERRGRLATTPSLRSPFCGPIRDAQGRAATPG
jgi:hypothetical protein